MPSHDYLAEDERARTLHDDDITDARTWAEPETGPYTVTRTSLWAFAVKNSAGEIIRDGLDQTSARELADSRNDSEHAAGHDPMQTLLARAHAARHHSHHCAGPCERRYLACLAAECAWRWNDTDARGVAWMCADCRDLARGTAEVRP